MSDREHVISALQVPSRVPIACRAHTPGQRERHHAVATRWGGFLEITLLGNKLQQTCLPSCSHSSPPQAPSWGDPGERVLGCFQLILRGLLWVEVPARAGPLQCQHTADSTSSHSQPRQPPHSHLLEKIIGGIEVQHRFT